MRLEKNGERETLVVEGQRTLHDGRVKHFETRSVEWLTGQTTEPIGTGTKFLGVLGGEEEFLFRPMPVFGVPGRLLSRAGLLDFLRDRGVATSVDTRRWREAEKSDGDPEDEDLAGADDPVSGD
ncbi:MAG: hypothetical protein WCW16_02575 [Candidatus Magasanikbacteria bacterium]